MQGSGPARDIMMFAGNVKWSKSIFDCTGAPWSAVIYLYYITNYIKNNCYHISTDS
jgi:hypothetical protein